MKAFFGLALAFSALALAGCVSERATHPPQTAMEELLISSAADRAADRLRLDLPRGTRIYVNARNFGTLDGKGLDARYAVAAITADLLSQGFAMMPNAASADVIVALRSGALSVDDTTTLLGIPSIPIPIPLAGTFTTPQIALYEAEEARGIAKFAATGYDARDGLWRAGSGARIGTATHTQRTIFFLFGSTSNDLAPKEVNRYK
jgi:Family of unknown function (DUF6655)